MNGIPNLNLSNQKMSLELSFLWLLPGIHYQCFLGDHLNTVTPEAAIFASTKQRLKTYCFDFFLKTFHEEFLSTFSNLGFWETTCVLFVSSGAVKRPSFRRAKKLCKETFIQTSNLIRFSYESFQLLSTKLPLPLNLAIL